MTVRGVSIREATLPTPVDGFFAALEPYTIYTKPLAVVAIWSRLNDPTVGAPGRRLDPRVLDRLAQTSRRPYIHAESYTPYARINEGALDDVLRQQGRDLRGRGAYWGFDQEMNGGTAEDPRFPWQAEPVYLWRQTATYVHGVLRSEAPDLQMVFTPSLRGRDGIRDDIAPYWTPRAFEAVGWTAYQRGPRRRVADQWDDLLAYYEEVAPGLPVVVTECGRLKGLPERLEYAKDLHRVRGVDVVIAFDMDLETKAHRWRFNDRQRRAFMTGA